jgi:hypothetical protein
MEGVGEWPGRKSRSHFYLHILHCNTMLQCIVNGRLSRQGRAVAGYDLV